MAQSQNPPSPSEKEDEFDMAMTSNVGIGCDQTLCQSVNQKFLIASIILDAALVLLGFLLWILFARKGWLTPFSSFLVLGLFVSMVSGVILWLNPFGDNTWRCCLASGEYAKYIVLSDLAAWSRGAIMGFAPVFLGLFLIIFLKKIITK